MKKRKSFVALLILSILIALGGAIMIHGNYQKGVPTAGCVAVSDNVMDILWPYGQLGIKVSVGP